MQLKKRDASRAKRPTPENLTQNTGPPRATDDGRTDRGNSFKKRPDVGDRCVRECERSDTISRLGVMPAIPNLRDGKPPK